MGVSKDSIIRWELSKNPPDVINLIAFAETTGCDPAWLITGAAQPQQRLDDREPTARELSERLTALLSKAEAASQVPTVIVDIESHARHPAVEGRVIRKSTEYVAMPLLRDTAAAGPPSEVDEREVEDVVLLSAKIVKGGTYTAIRVRGDSMAPRIPDGSIVAINHERRDPKKLEGHIVCARIGDGITVKWLQTQHGQLMLVPENVSANRVQILADTDDIIGAVECLWAPLP